MLNMLRSFARNLPIGQKLNVSLIIFIFLPLLTALVIINSNVSQVVTAKTQENVFQSFKQTQLTLETMIQDTMLLSLSLFSDERIQSLIHFYSKESNMAELMKRELQAGWGNYSFHSIFAAKPYLHSFSFSRGGDLIYQYGIRVVREDPQFSGKAAELKGKAFWTGLHRLDTYGGMPDTVISLIRAVNDLDTGKHIADLRISIKEEELANLYAGIQAWSGSFSFLIDSQGTVVSSPDKSMLGNSLKDEPYIRRILGQREGILEADIGGVAHYVFHYRLEDAGWHAVLMVPAGELAGQIQVINSVIYLCLAICLIFGIFYSILQNRTIVRPLKHLASEMGKVKNGIFEVNIQSRSEDEIGLVSATFVNMVRQTKELIDKVYKSRLRENAAELKALQSQIHPHFLYNTLDSIRWLAVKNKDLEVAEQLEALSDLFRHVLSKGGVMTTIGEELEHLRNYMKLQLNRFGDKIEFIEHVNPELLPLKTLKLILQPLVENAIVHGLEPKMGKGKIKLTILAEDGVLRYIVEDDGVGMDEERLRSVLAQEDETGRVSALRNINDRIQLCFGKKYGLKIESRPGEGTRVQAAMPLEIEGEVRNDEAYDSGR